MAWRTNIFEIAQQYGEIWKVPYIVIIPKYIAGEILWSEATSREDAESIKAQWGGGRIYRVK